MHHRGGPEFHGTPQSETRTKSWPSSTKDARASTKRTAASGLEKVSAGQRLEAQITHKHRTAGRLRSADAKKKRLFKDASMSTKHAGTAETRSSATDQNNITVKRYAKHLAARDTREILDVFALE